MGIAISAEHVSKEYRLGVINHGMLYKDVQSWIAKRTGRPDPHARIGTEHFANQADRFWALKDVDFDIQQGERVGIIGKNGAGKSTLLKILSRITAPTEGIVKIKGKVTSLLEVGTGFHPELTGRENIYLNGAILGMKRGQVTKRLEEIIAFSEIEQFIDTPVKRYSSGMYVRLAFSVAAHLESDILLADEVLAVGDASFQKKCIGKMENVSLNEGKTIIFVSHNSAAVRSLCNKGICFEKGSISDMGNAEEVLRNYLHMNSASEMQWSRDLTGISRYGNGAAQGTRVEMTAYSADGEKTGMFFIGDDLEVKLQILAIRDLTNANVECILSDEYGTKLVYGNMTMLGKNFKLKAGQKAIVRWLFRKMMLNVGIYTLRLYIGEPNLDIDSMDEVLALRVEEPANSPYRVTFPGRYRCEFDLDIVDCS
jgi:lipopolysaccharide transport system ATP-binding protein